MLIVLPVCKKDEHLALLNLKLCAKWEASLPFGVLVAHERGFDPAAVVAAVKELTANVEVFEYDPCPLGAEWPRPQNWAWQSVARHIGGGDRRSPWLWWEQDAVPCCRGWAQQLSDAYNKGGKLYGGSFVEQAGYKYLSGVAIYPWDVALRVESALLTRSAPWDVVLSVKDRILEDAHNLTPLLTHDFRSDGGGRVWAVGDAVPTGVALWHRCKDGSLQELLLGQPRAAAAQLKQEPARSAPLPVASEVATDLPVVVQLGRLGDILNILPVLRAMSQSHQQRQVRLMMHSSMLPAVQRLRYVKPVLWNGALNDVRGATEAAAKLGGPTPVVAQLFSNEGLKVDKHRSFAITQYERLNYLGHWGHLYLEFDARDWAQEAAVKRTLAGSSDEPYVVTNVLGLSSPFKRGAELLKGLRDAGIRVVDVSNYKVQAMADMLGLLDSAAAIVTVDTALLHLANASIAPIVALVSDIDGDVWRATAPVRPRAYEVGYSKADMTTLVGVVQKLVAEGRWRPQCGRSVHIMPRRFSTHSRVDQALLAFERLYASGALLPRHVWSTRRTADQTMGDPRDLPFLRDVVEQGLPGLEDDAVVILTNDDVWLHPEALPAIRRRLSYAPLVTAHRTDLLGAACFGSTCEGAEHHAGRDLFAATVGWWRQNLELLPDFIVGASDWDLVMAAWARKLVGAVLKYDNVWLQHPVCELPFGLLQHLKHEETWNRPENVDKAPSQIHNRALAAAWFRENGDIVPHWGLQ